VQCLTTGCPDPIVITDAFKGEIPVDEPAGEPGVPSGQARPDLAAMTLTPADLDELEMPGYGIGFGQTAYPEDLTASIAENRGLPEEEVRSRLQGAGFVRRYDSQLYLPADETDPTGTFGRTVASYVVQFADEGGAASAWDFLEDESGNSLAGDIPLSTPIGDQSEATQENILDSETGEPYIQIDVTFRTGNLHAGVAIIDWEGGLVELPEVEAAAHRLLERVQTGLSGTAPGLDGLTFRLSGEQIIPSADYYTLVAGEAIPQYGESPQDVAARESAAASDGQTEIYSLQQELSTGTEAPDDDTWYLLELTRFTDDDAATRWLGGSQERISGNDALKDAEFVDGPTYGSESVHYTLTTADGQTGHRGISFRVGNIVASIEVAAPTTPLAMFAQALASAQERCLEDGGCPEPVSLSSDTGS
jgi:hypothetical protein